MLTVRDFSIGEKVRFGRGRGEKTLGEVVKVNRSKLKIKQLESRGRNRSYPIGTVWTVPPSLCEKVGGASTTSTTSTPTRRTPVSRPKSPREILAAKGITTGDVVEFTFRTVDGICTGTIKSINAKRVTIEQVSTERERLAPKTFTRPKYPRGVYCNPGDIIRKVGAAPKAPPKPKLTLKVGTGVVFKGYEWRSKSEVDVTGVITKVNHSKGTYEIFGGGYGRVDTLEPSKILGTITRDNDDIMGNFNSVYGALSPENLTCDGELSRSQIRAKSARLNRALRALSKELGREVSESESWAWWDANHRNAG